MNRREFDRAYFQRFYFNPRTRIADQRYFDRLAAFVVAYLDLLECPLRRVLDAGSGPGLVHAGLRRAKPGLRIDAIDVSRHACEAYGWKCVAIEDYEVVTTYDLVICHDVLQYLDRRRAVVALEKLARATHCALLFGVLTREDWNVNCDQDLTDGDVHLRSAAWYRQRLAPRFRNAGGGLYLRRDAPAVLYALEHL